MEANTAEKILTRFVGGLSRLLSYAYGGFLAVVILRVLEPARTNEFFKGLSWEFAVLACIVVGAGVYRAHRSAFIPFHHWVGCLLFWLWDRKNHTLPKDSVSPTRWFRALDVPKYRLILAYTILRHDPKFLEHDEQERVDLKHAEFGLVVMAAEACFIGFGYALWHQSSNPTWWVWLGASLLLFAASYPAPLQQHAIECPRWKEREVQSHAVSETLKKYGLLKQRPSSGPPNPALHRTAAGPKLSGRG